MQKKKFSSLNSLSGLVYSTNPDAMQPEPEATIETLAPHLQQLKVYIDKKKRAGKTVTVVEGFVGNLEDLNNLGKELKTKCGVGGSVKDGIIIIQGDYKVKAAEWLQQWKYKVKML